MTTMFMRTITDAANITTVLNLSLNILQAIELSTPYIQENIDIKGWITHTIYDGSTKGTQPYTMAQQKECNYEQWFISGQHNHIQSMRINLYNAPRSILITYTRVPTTLTTQPCTMTQEWPHGTTPWYHQQRSEESRIRKSNHHYITP